MSFATRVSCLREDSLAPKGRERRTSVCNPLAELRQHQEAPDRAKKPEGGKIGNSDLSTRQPHYCWEPILSKWIYKPLNFLHFLPNQPHQTKGKLCSTPRHLELGAGESRAPN